MQAKTSITINKPIGEVYAYWLDFEKLPSFMYHLESVTDGGGGRSHWKAKAPAGASVEWDAEIVEQIDGSLIAWQSMPGASVENSGSVRFTAAPGDQGTEVTVDIDYSPPGGAVGSIVAKLFGEEPRQQVKDDLRRFKQVLETGEVVVSDGSPDGTRVQRQLRQRPGQPAGDAERARS